MRTWLLLLLPVTLLTDCGSGSLDPENEDLSRLLAVTNVVKTPVPSGEGSALVGAVLVDVDVVNTAFFPIDRAFRMTWALRGEGGNVASASFVFSSGLEAGESRNVHLRIPLEPPREDVSDLQDAVTFDLLDLPGSG